jgi:hypothetical protein
MKVSIKAKSKMKRRKSEREASYPQADKFWLSSMSLRGMASPSAQQAAAAAATPTSALNSSAPLPSGAGKGSTKVGLDRESAVDREASLKNELARKWDDFMKTLPKKERRGGHTYKVRRRRCHSWS